MANAGLGRSVGEGVQVQLYGSASSDPDGDALSYQWSQTAGLAVVLSDSANPTPTFAAPTGLTADEALIFELRVSDGQLSSNAAVVTITVLANRAPKANAGPDQVVVEGVQVQLTGTGSSDPDGDALTYQWTQTAGPAAGLSDPSSPTPTFAAPTGLTADATLTFDLSVFDNRFSSSPDSITVTVRAAVPANLGPVANAGSDQAVAEGVPVQLDGTASSDPDGDALIYQWVQTAGPSVVLSDPASPIPAFVAPTGLASAATLSFKLQVFDGALTSTPDTVTVTVIAAASQNIARRALTVTASSQNTAQGQPASKAIDGYVDGYPGDQTHEWATRSEKAGAWLQLTWEQPQEITRVVLYDRPNSSDQILLATLTFSDGSSVQVGPLINAGTGVAVSFPAKVITSLRMTVNNVSTRTSMVGLAEIEVFGVGGSI